MKVTEAIRALKQTLIDELKAAKQEGSRAFEQSEFEVAQAAARRGVKIGGFLQQVEALELMWESGEPEEPIPEPPGKVEKPTSQVGSGSDSKEDDYVMPILQALQELGGKGSAHQVMDQIEAILDPSVLKGQSGSNGWRLAAQTASAAMVKKGFISAESPEGEWKLTTKGRLYFFEQQ